MTERPLVTGSVAYRAFLTALRTILAGRSHGQRITGLLRLVSADSRRSHFGIFPSSIAIRALPARDGQIGRGQDMVWVEKRMQQSARGSKPNRSFEPPAETYVIGIAVLVLDGHRFRIDGFLARDAFKPCKNSSIFILVTLHREAALGVPGGPSDSDVVLL